MKKSLLIENGAALSWYGDVYDAVYKKSGIVQLRHRSLYILARAIHMR
jgi:hypothetical protein